MLEFRIRCDVDQFVADKLVDPGRRERACVGVECVQEILIDR